MQQCYDSDQHINNLKPLPLHDDEFPGQKA